jgi:sugar O-acyltransferase (sialic acid O-acetyltransferase NeuD family)
MKLVIVGDSAIAEVAYEYFTVDSPYEVAAFAVERDYLKRDQLFGLPVVAFEEVESRYPPDSHCAFVAVGFAQMNRLRERLYHAAKAKGYTLASYVSSKAFVWRNVTMGDNCFILEQNVLQPFVTIGSDVVLWSGNHIGHHVTIGNHCFFSSHVVLSGFVEVGAYAFFGVNASVAHNVKVGESVLVGAGATILRDAEGRKFYAVEGTKPRGDTLSFFGIEERK